MPPSSGGDPCIRRGTGRQWRGANALVGPAPRLALFAFLLLWFVAASLCVSQPQREAELAGLGGLDGLPSAPRPSSGQLPGRGHPSDTFSLTYSDDPTPRRDAQAQSSDIELVSDTCEAFVRIRGEAGEPIPAAADLCAALTGRLGPLPAASNQPRGQQWTCAVYADALVASAKRRWAFKLCLGQVRSGAIRCTRCTRIAVADPLLVPLETVRRSPGSMQGCRVRLLPK
eukprot:357298-Chlamydomonas_euryale.AAC.2